jgi:Domain of unknown function (DUF4279)
MKVSEPSRYCFSKLYVRGTDLDPDEVTKLLGVSSDRSYRRGERSFRLRLDGTLTDEPSGVVHNAGMWQCSIDAEKAKLWAAEGQLEYWCEFLEQRISEVRLLQCQGCKIIVDFRLEEGPVTFLEFSAEIFERLANLKINLNYGFYDTTSPMFQLKTE